MEIMLECPCGHSFAFDEEPIRGRVGTLVSCPHCGQDRTALANDLLTAAPSGVSNLAEAGKALSNFGAGQQHLRLDPNQLQAPSESGARESQAGSSAAATGTRLALGMAAAIGAAVLGVFVWQWIALKTGFHFAFLAWAMGGLVGWSARLLSPKGSLPLATIAGVSTLVAVLAGHIVVTEAEADNAISREVERAYRANLDYARQGLKLRTDSEIKTFLAEHAVNPNQAVAQNLGPAGEKLSLSQQRELYFVSFALFGFMDGGKDLPPCQREQGFPLWRASHAQNGDPSGYSDADVLEFREKEAPELQRFLEGQPAKQEWKDSLTAAIYDRIRFKDVIVNSIGPFTIIWMIFGFVTACRLALCTSETEDT